MAGGSVACWIGAPLWYFHVPNEAKLNGHFDLLYDRVVPVLRARSTSGPSTQSRETVVQLSAVSLVAREAVRK